MKNFFKYIILTVLLSTFSLHAQEDKHEKIQALKVAHLTKELDLTADEAKVFWPIYDLYSDKIHKLYRKKKGGHCSKVKLDEMSDTEALQALRENQKLEEQILQTRKQMNEELLQVMSASKVLKLQRAEKDFFNKLLKQYRNCKRD